MRDEQRPRHARRTSPPRRAAGSGSRARPGRAGGRPPPSAGASPHDRREQKRHRRRDAEDQRVLAHPGRLVSAQRVPRGHSGGGRPERRAYAREPLHQRAHAPGAVVLPAASGSRTARPISTAISFISRSVHPLGGDAGVPTRMPEADDRRLRVVRDRVLVQRDPRGVAARPRPPCRSRRRRAGRAARGGCRCRRRRPQALGGQPRGQRLGVAR